MILSFITKKALYLNCNRELLNLIILLRSIRILGMKKMLCDKLFNCPDCM